MLPDDGPVGIGIEDDITSPEEPTLKIRWRKIKIIVIIKVSGWSEPDRRGCPSRRPLFYPGQKILIRPPGISIPPGESLPAVPPPIDLVGMEAREKRGVGPPRLFPPSALWIEADVLYEFGQRLFGKNGEEESDRFGGYPKPQV